MRLVLPVLVAVAVIMPGCRSNEISGSKEGPVQKVHIYKAEMITAPGTEEVPGTVRPKLFASIEAKIPGRVEKMLVSEGQTVQEGQLLAQLDAKEVQARLDQALAMKDQAEQDLRRFTSLVQQKAATQAEYDGVDAKARVARAEVVETQTMLSYAQVKAPFSGLITKKLTDVGDLASPGKPLFEIEDPSALRFEAGVPETFITRIKPGSSFEVNIPTLEKSLKGAVAEVSPTADPNSRTFLVKVDLPPAPGLRSGQFGHVAVPAEQASMINVPAAAVLQRGQMEVVYVVKDGRAWMRLVRTGRKLGSEVELLAGLDPGESIAVDNIAVLKDGQNVEVI